MQKLKQWLRKPILRCTAVLAVLVLTAASAGTSYAKYQKTYSAGSVNLSYTPESLKTPTLTAVDDLEFYLNGMMRSGSQWTDLSNNGNHATIYNDTDWINALPSVEGGSRFAYFAQSFNRTTPFTMETTITLRYNDFYYDNIDYERELFGNWQGGGYGLSLIWESNAPRVVAYLGDDSTDTTSPGYARAVSNVALTVGATYTLAMTYDGSKIQVWVDGTSRGSDTVIGTPNTVASTVHMGICCDPEVNNYRQYGPSCDVYTARLYNRALSQSELSQNASYDKQFTYNTRDLKHFISTDKKINILSTGGATSSGGGYVLGGSSEASDYITLSFDSSEWHYYSAGFTMDCMFSVSSLPGSAQVIASNYGVDGGYGLEISGSTLILYVYDSGTWKSVSASNKVSAGQKCVATCVYSTSGKTLELFVNGSSAGKVSVSGNYQNGWYSGSITNDEYFMVGANPDYDNRQDGSANGVYEAVNFKGTIYSFGLYSRPLSSSEVSTNYNYLRKSKYDDGLVFGGVTFTATDNNSPAQTLQLSTNNSSWNTGSSQRYTSPAQYALYARAISSRGVASTSTNKVTADTRRSYVTSKMIGTR